MEDYRLQQSGQEVQNILDGAAMQTDLTAETERAELAEQTLQGHIDDEALARQTADGVLQGHIDNEETRAKAAEKRNADDIDAIEEKLPAGASSSNKLATEEYVDDSVATASATFRGTYNLVSDFHLTPSATHLEIAGALLNAISTADNNDYAFVQIPTSVDTPTEIASIERYKFNGTAWAYEYTLNNSGFTSAQWAAINSGITSGLVTKLGALPTADELAAALLAKQNVLTWDTAPTPSSTNPVTSGGIHTAIDNEKTARQNSDAALQQAIEAILLLIPSAASALNQLADKAFVNSSVATATATFRGTYNLVSDLHLTVDATHADIAAALLSAISTADNNDYAFVQVPTSVDTPTEIRVTERYKFDGTSWAYEYDLNNSGFTAAQWAAINSGITQLLVTKLGALPTNAELTTALAGKQNVLTFDTMPTSGSTNPVTSGGIFSALAGKQNTLTFDNTPTEGSNNPVKSGGIYTAIALVQAAVDALTGRMTDAEGDIAANTGNIATNTADIALLQDLYEALTQSALVVVNGALPSSGQQQKTIYRQPDQGHTPPQFYSDYMWNGTTWVLMATYNNAIDPRPKKGSQNLVTSGGVFDNMGALDVSELNATENPHALATYADLSAALAAIPSDYKKGGMSIKFLQTSDNKYIQARCMAQSFTTDVTQWQMTTDKIAFNNRNLPNSDTVEKAFWSGEPDTVIDMRDYIELPFFITYEDKWAPSNNSKSKLVPVLGGKRYIIKNINSREWYYAFLTTDSHVSGSDASYATGCSRETLNIGDEQNIFAPADARYLFVTTYLTPDTINPVVKKYNKHDIRETVNDIRLENSIQESDFDITDENYYAILRLLNGHIQTKYFNSEDVENLKIQDSTQIADFDITDENFYSILRLLNGHIQTKNFNSEDIVNKVTELLNHFKSAENSNVVRFSDFKNQNNTDDEAISDMLSFSSIFEERTLIIDSDITISKAILLSSNTTVIVDGATIRQSDYSFDNVFRGANVPWNYEGNDEDDFIAAHDKTAWTSFLAELPSSISPMQNIKIIGKNGAKIIGNNINATIHYIYGNETQTLVGDFYGIRTHQIDFSYVDNIEISGFELSKTRGWAISFDICKNIEIHDMVINSNVKTGDGIDFRYGCKNVKCYNISGSIYDDVVACTCLPDMNAEQHDINGKYMFAAQASRNIYYSQETLQDLYIENVSIQNVSYKGSHDHGHGVICLSAFGGKVQNIAIENIEELTGGVAKESVVKIYTGYGTGYTAGDLNKIRVNEVHCSISTYAFICNCVCDDIWLNKLTSDTSLTQIYYMQGFKITNSN